jgi:hypothetical protein
MNALILLKYHYKFKLKALRSEKDYLLKIILILFFLGFIVLFTFILKALIPANDLVLLKKIYLPIIGMQVISLINSSGLSGSIYPYLKLPIKKLPLLTLIVFEEILLKKILFITSTLCIALTISTSILLSTWTV